ncbi:MAG: alkaline phosphatase [Alphaproteobacteria bacterium]|nr:alkaline phosphatase [Alphaproteobacteria bacterium]
MIRICVSMACLLSLSACASSGGPTEAPPPAVRQQQDSYYQSAAKAVSGREAERGAPRAKNVILFIGDGMGVSTITAGRIWAGQNRGVDGESYRLAMETLPYSAFAKTYTHDSQVADSAPTATAMTTGVKSYNGTIGVTQSADIRKCVTAETASADSLWEIAEDAGLATGVISTARLTHATPAATYAKTTERDWENDAQVSPSGKEAGCRDIARQFVDWRHGDGFEVFMGGGRANFLPSTLVDPEYPNLKGARADGRDLTREWAEAGSSRRVVTDLAGFRGVNFDSDVQVLGLFEPSHMQYEADRARDRAGEPSLADLTRAAITRLSRNPKGYVLMVEAGRIDHAHHAGNAARALADTAALDEAVAAAMAASDPRDTLIIVTADHSHTFVIQGYPGRNNPILGLVTYPDGKGAVRGLDSRPFTTLAYMNGPGSICRISPQGNVCNREDLSKVDTQALDYVQQALIPLPSETHGGEDVAVFARGPGAQLVSGTIEQNEIFHVMARSLGLVR